MSGSSTGAATRQSTSTAASGTATTGAAAVGAVAGFTILAQVFSPHTTREGNITGVSTGGDTTGCATFGGGSAATAEGTPSGARARGAASVSVASERQNLLIPPAIGKRKCIAAFPSSKGGQAMEVRKPRTTVRAGGWSRNRQDSPDERSRLTREQQCNR